MYLRGATWAALAATILLAVTARAQTPPPPMFLLEWGQYGEKPGHFSYPQGLATDGDGLVYVADTYNHRIQKFTDAGVWLSSWKSKNPGSIAVGPAGCVYVCSAGGQFIERYMTDGTPLDRWGGPCLMTLDPLACPPGAFKSISGVAVDGDGMVYVLDAGLRRVQKFDASGNVLLIWGVQGKGDGEFEFPTGIAVDGSGYVYVVDSKLYRVQKFDGGGTFLAKWGSYGRNDGEFNGELGVACALDGNVLVSDRHACRIQMFTGTGTFICKWGTKGDRPGEFYEPADMDVGPDGSVYVCDRLNHRIQKFGWACAPTPVGANVQVALPTTEVSLTFDTVVEPGMTCIGTTGGSGPEPPHGFHRGKCVPDYLIWTSARYLGTVRICVTFRGEKCFPSPPQVQLFELVDGAWMNHASTVELIAKDLWQLCATVADLGTIALFDPTRPYGTIRGPISADCAGSSSPLAGVTVDIYEPKRPDLVASAVSQLDGTYSVPDLPWKEYRVAVVPPLGYAFAAPDTVVHLKAGATVEVPFVASCLPIVPRPRSAGYWKHQLSTNLSMRGNAQVDSTTLCGYLDAIVGHFNSNALNPVVIYQEPSWGECREKLEVAAGLLNLHGSAEMTARARQQLLALLLNVAAGHLSLVEVISADGATVSQAITYCDHLIDDPLGDHELAKTIADEINNGRAVAEGVIPLSTPQIAYRLRGPLADPTVIRVRPNPARGAVVVQYTVPARGAQVLLEIFDISGARVRRLVDEAQVGGDQRVPWFGLDERGHRVSPGMYLYRARIGEVVTSGRFVMLPR